MDKDVLAALNRVNAQRIDGLFIILNALEVLNPSEDGIRRVRDSLQKIRESMLRGENRQDEWQKARETVEDLISKNLLDSKVAGLAEETGHC